MARNTGQFPKRSTPTNRDMVIKMDTVNTVDRTCEQRGSNI